MIFAVFLLLVSLGAVAASVVVAGAGDLLLLAGPGVLAGLVLLWRAWRGRRALRPAVVDGSNVLFWRGNTPRLETVREVVDALVARGWTPAVVFDANVGYKIGDGYQGDAALARALGLPHDRVTVVPRGEPADPAILTLARDRGARVVSNDRFRDWQEAFPEAAGKGFALRGGYRKGRLWLDPA